MWGGLSLLWWWAFHFCWRYWWKPVKATWVLGKVSGWWVWLCLDPQLGFYPTPACWSGEWLCSWRWWVWTADRNHTRGLRTKFNLWYAAAWTRIFFAAFGWAGSANPVFWRSKASLKSVRCRWLRILLNWNTCLFLTVFLVRIFCLRVRYCVRTWTIEWIFAGY